MRAIWQIWAVTGGLLAATLVQAEDPTKPTFRSLAGALLFTDDHSYFVESELRLPLLREGRVGLTYHHHEATPFLDVSGDVQAESLYGRDELEVDLNLSEYVRLIALGGYRVAYLEDRTGKFSAFVWGGGVGAPERTDGERLHWHVLAGGFSDRRVLDADWWTDVYASWRMFYFIADQYLESRYRASVNLSARIESANESGHLRSFYKAGPEIQFLTANGNRANLELHWFQNDENPFYGSDDRGVFLGLNVISSRDDEYLWHVRQGRQPGWFPLIWGSYDVAAGTTRRVTRFEMSVEAVDFVIADHLYTFTAWYETHQEHRAGDFDNVSYSVTVGVQTPVGWESPLSQGQPLIAGADFLHRSDHALNPNADRVAPGALIESGSLNVLPRLRLQTIGWDLPYRDPSMYERQTAWLNFFDWRITAGYDTKSSRDRSPLAAQIGLNWDVATIEGFVVYARGLASAGNESPDWLAELGVRRPAGRVFTRFESYGIDANIASGTIWVVGAGVNL